MLRSMMAVVADYYMNKRKSNNNKPKGSLD